LTYTLKNKRTVNIPDKEIEKLQKNLELSEKDAIELWLIDNDYLDDEEQDELDAKAKKVKISRGASGNDKQNATKKRTCKISEEKKEHFQTILRNLDRCVDVEPGNITILKENKLIEVKIGEKIFKIDIIEQRPKKN